MRRRELLFKADTIKPGLPEAPGCYIAFHRKSDGANCAVTADVWPDLQNAGEVADGVLLHLEGKAPIVMAPTNASPEMLYWSPYSVSCNSWYQKVELVKTTYNGRDLINNIVAKISGNYAGPLCYQYSRPGIPTTKWWLPSGGELQDIYDHKDAINSCLEYISEASQLSDDYYYWTSVESSDVYAWCMDFKNGSFYNVFQKYSRSYYVRPVAAFE